MLKKLLSKLYQKKEKKEDFEKTLDKLIKYKDSFYIYYEENGTETIIKAESLIKPSKPPKRSSISLKTSKTEELDDKKKDDE